MYKIGVFDSGIGGEAIARQLRLAFPGDMIIAISDSKNAPYGSKRPEEIIELTYKAIAPLLKCDVIVIACNTATSYAIQYLRGKYPSHQFVGIEPMLKTASELTRSKVITVCATPATLRSARYEYLKSRYASDLTVIEPDCSKWAQLIEESSLNREQIHASIAPSLERGSDVIVLGCTHYHWIKDDIKKIASNAVAVLEPSEAIASRVARVLAQIGNGVSK